MERRPPGGSVGQRAIVPGARFWHVTDEEDFTPSPARVHVTQGGYGTGAGTLSATSSPFYWSRISGGGMGPYTADRRYAVELEVLPSHPIADPPIREQPTQPEVALDPAHVRVTRVVLIDDAITEETGYDRDDHYVGRRPAPDIRGA